MSRTFASPRGILLALCLASGLDTAAQEPQKAYTLPTLPEGTKTIEDGDDVITTSTKWKYFHPLDGVDPGDKLKSFHSSWHKAGFDDSKWKQGNLLLGYGGAEMSSGARVGPTAGAGTPERGNRYSMYLRHVFFQDKAGQYDVEFVFARDDAAIVYLNGQEILRSCQPDAVEFLKAPDAYKLCVSERSASWTEGDAELALHQHFVRNVRLNRGNNVVAVSLHNALQGGAARIAGSSDLLFVTSYFRIGPAGSAPREEKSEPAPDLPPPPAAWSGEASPEAFEKLSGGGERWDFTAEALEANFAGHKFQWLDPAKARAQIIPRNGQPTILGTDIPAVETSLDMKDGKLARTQFLIYTRGDSGSISRQDFEALVAKCTAALTARAGSPGKERGAADGPKSAVKVSATTWQSASFQFLLEASVRKGAARDPFTAEFIRLTVVPAAGKAPPGQVPQATAPGVKRSDLAANLKKSENGDVFIHSVPMVDQGQKGYCAVASAERVLRYYGIQTDQHELAQISSASAETGTNPAAMYEALGKLRGRFKFQLREVMPWDYDKFVELVTAYNKYVRETDDDYVQYPRNGNIDPVIASMNGEVLIKIKARPADLKKFQKSVEEAISDGVPLMWGVHLGLFQEPGIPQVSGGHMRLIIGYNARTQEVIYSDSWGNGHELKRMAADKALAITDQLHFIRPTR